MSSHPFNVRDEALVWLISSRLYFFHKFKKWSCSQCDTDKINKWSNYQKQNLFCMQPSHSLVYELFSSPSVWLCEGLSWLHVFPDVTCLAKKDDRVQTWESWPFCQVMESLCAYQGAVDAPGHGWFRRALGFANQDFMLTVIAALLGQL